MATTSLKLPREIKDRAAKAAEGQGLSPHAFMVAAIEQATEAAEKRAGFIEDALAAREETLRTGLGYTAEDVHGYLRERVSGQAASRPEVKRWRD